MSVRDFSKYDVGQGLCIDGYVDGYDNGFALIVGISDIGVDVVPVRYLFNGSCMFNLSNREEDKDNVPLESCPPPFTNRYDMNVYAYANMSDVGHIAFSEFDKYRVKTSDNYHKISDKDMALVLDHDKTQPQKELDRLAMLDDLLSATVSSDRNKEDDYVLD